MTKGVPMVWWLMCSTATSSCVTFRLKPWEKIWSLFSRVMGQIVSRPYLPTPPLGQDMTQGQFKQSLAGLNSEFSFSSISCLTKAEEPSLSYLPIAGGRIIEVIPFPRVLVLCDKQSVSSRIWTRVAMSISYDDNHNTTENSSTIVPLHKNAASNIEQVLAATPHKAPTIRPPDYHHENYPS